MDARCLKITGKVSFNIASEASYVYILSGQKFIKNAKNCQIWWKLSKFKNSNKTFWVIFKHCWMWAKSRIFICCFLSNENDIRVWFSRKKAKYVPRFFICTFYYSRILFDSFMLKSSLLRFLLAHLCAKPKKNFCIEEEDEKRNVSTIAKCLNRKFSRGKVHFLQILLQMKIPCESSTQKEIAFLLN